MVCPRTNTKDLLGWFPPLSSRWRESFLLLPIINKSELFELNQLISGLIEFKQMWWWEDERAIIYNKFGYQHITENIIVDPIPTWRYDTVYKHFDSIQPIPLILDEVPLEEMWFKHTQIFAGVDVPVNGFVGTLTGEIITESRVQKRLDSGATNAKFLYPVNDYFFQKDSLQLKLWLDTNQWGNNLRFLEHSCSANCDMSYEIKNGAPTVVVWAIKNIKEDELLTYNHFPATLINPANIAKELIYGCKCRTTECKIK